jgi:hypothetical protein
MKNATKLAFWAILVYGLATAMAKANFSLSFPLFLAISLLFIGLSTKTLCFHYQIALKFVVKYVMLTPTRHSIFLNHKNSII